MEAHIPRFATGNVQELMGVLRVSISTFQETARPGWVLLARVTEVLIKN